MPADEADMHYDDPVMEAIGICHRCVHRRGVRTCKAFPGGIPSEILVGDFMHVTPFPGDNGIQYERRLA